MYVKFVGTVNNVFRTDRGRTYYTLAELNGGVVKFSVNGGELVGLKEGATVSGDLELSGRMGKDGGLNLEYRSGHVRAVNVTYSDAEVSK